MAHHDIAMMTTTTTGTGTLTLGSAVSGFLSFADAGVADGEAVTFVIKDGTEREFSRGIYTASGTTLTRVTVLKSTNANAKISLSGGATVFLALSAKDTFPVNEWDRIVLKDDFIAGTNTSGNLGELGWLFSNGTMATIASEAGHPGMINRGHNSTSHASMTLLGGAPLCRYQDIENLVLVFKVTTAFDGNGPNWRFGLINAQTSTPTDGVYIERLAADAGWYGVVRKASTQTRTAQLLATDNNWHNFKIRRDSSTSWTFIVDGTETTISGDSNIPTDSDLAFPIISLLNASGSTQRNMYLDFYQLRMNPVAR